MGTRSHFSGKAKKLRARRLHRCQKKRARKCKLGRKAIFECPAVCDEQCATSSPTTTPTTPRGVCVNNPDSFEWKGKEVTCDGIAALNNQQKSRKCREGRRVILECPAVCDEECLSTE